MEQVSILEIQIMKKNVPCWLKKRNHQHLVHHIGHRIDFVGLDSATASRNALSVGLVCFKVLEN